MNLLALDVASTTGWASGRIGDKPVSGSVRFAKKGATDDEVWRAALIWLNDALKVHQPDVVAIEAPIMSSGAGGQSNPKTMMRLIGLQAVLRTVVKAKLPNQAKLIHVQSARKFFIGHGNLPGKQAKGLVLKRSIELGWLDECEGDTDRADALCVWAKAAGDLDPNFAANLVPLFSKGAA